MRYHGPRMRAQQFFARALFTLRILWGAVTFSSVLMAVLAFAIPSKATIPPDLMTQGVLYASALAVAIASFVVPARNYATAAGRQREETHPAEPTPDGRGSSARFAHPEQAARRASASFFTPFVISVALSDAVSNLGLALHMVGGSMIASTVLLAAGTLLCMLRFPSMARLTGPFERIQGASFAASEGGSY